MSTELNTTTKAPRTTSRQPKAARLAAETALAAPSPPPTAPADKSARAALDYMIACNAWIEAEVHSHLHGEDAVDLAVDTVLRPAEIAFDTAPIVTPDDVRAKVQGLIYYSKRGLGDLSGREAQLEQIDAALAGGGPPSGPIIEALGRLTAKDDTAKDVQEHPASFAEAWAKYEAAHVAHGAAIDAYGKIERRVFANEIGSEDADYIAADQAQGDRAHESALAFAAMVDSPATSLIDIRRKLAAMQLCDMVARQRRPAYDADREQIDEEACFLSLISDLISFASGPTNDPAAAIWALHLQEYNVAHDEWQRARATRDAVCDAISAQMPDEIVDHTRKDHRLERWHSAVFVDQDQAIPRADRERLKVVVTNWRARKEHLEAEGNIKALEAAEEAADTAVWTALTTLLRTPAPDAAALALKINLWAREVDDDKGGFDDMGYVLAQADSYIVDEMPVRFYQDALRLAGQDHPILHLADWKPSDWVQRFEDIGGWATVSDHRQFRLDQPGGCPERRPDATALMAELYAVPGRARAVQIVVEQRTSQGGDPRLNSDGTPKLYPCAPSKPYPAVAMAAE